MKFSINQATLNDKLKSASRFISTKPQLPILSCFYLEVKDQTCHLIATDLNIGIRLAFPVKQAEDGVCVVPAKIFTELISTLSGEIEIQLENQTVTVKSKEVVSEVNTFPADDFPPFPQPEGEEWSLSADSLTQAIDSVGLASSRDESRPILTCLYFDLGDTPALAATDGYRLAVLESEEIKNLKKQNAQILFPTRWLEEVVKLFPAKLDQVKFSVSEGMKQAFFNLPEVEVVIRLMDGEYPPYRQIIPADFAGQISFQADDAAHHIKSAMIFSRDTSSIVQLTTTADGLEIAATSSVVGGYKGTIQAKSTLKSEFKIAFNGRFLLEFLQKISGEECQMSVNDPLKPAVFTTKSLPDYRYVVMPFRLNE